MTDYLFLHDAFLKECDATVTAVKDGAVTLDKTVFYYTSGGQPHDVGTLNDIWVSKVVKEDGEAWHYIEGSLNVGDKVHAVIDWDRRYQLMRTHTALHILCGAIWREWKIPVTGGNMEPLTARMDFEFDPLPEGFAGIVEKLCNEAVAADYPIEVSFIPRDQAVNEEDLVRTKVSLIPEGLSEIRMLDIVGFDKQADGGTHVKSTKDVGVIKVVKTESKGKGNKRVRIAIEDV